MSETMTVARLETETGRLQVVRAPVPRAGPGQLRLRVAHVGLCHTDLHFIDGELAARMPSAVIPGHAVRSKRPVSCQTAPAAAPGQRNSTTRE